MPRTKTDFNTILGSRIRLARSHGKVSQATLAGMLGVSFQQVQKYENGANRVSVESLIKIAAALGRPMSEFIEPEPEGTAAPLPGIRDLAAAGAALSRLEPGVRRRVLALVDEIASGVAPAEIGEAA